jgi:hypothetical protein
MKTNFLIPFCLLFFLMLGSCNNKFPETCTDGLINQDEEDVDCGGSCDPCPTCVDENQNGLEDGIDCGGPCSLDCYTTPPCSLATNTIELGSSIYTITHITTRINTSGDFEIYGNGTGFVWISFDRLTPPVASGDYIITNFLPESVQVHVHFQVSSGGTFYTAGGIAHIEVENGVTTVTVCDEDFSSSFLGDINSSLKIQF